MNTTNNIGRSSVKSWNLPNRFWGFLILTFMWCAVTFSQDIHFTHIYNTNITTNPAITGLFEGKERVVLSVRDQWTAGHAKYNTYFFAGDIKLRSEERSKIGIGLSVFRDVAGDLEVSNTKAMLALSALFSFGDQDIFTMALEGGYSQQSINTAGMIWDAQYVNGTYSAANPTLENYNFSPFGFPDFAFGVGYFHSNTMGERHVIEPDDATETEIGASIHHLLKPNYGFGPDDKLYRKVLIHYKGMYHIYGTHFGFKPGFLYTRQGPHQELGIGSLIKWRLRHKSKFTGYYKDKILSFGGYYRFKDAFVPSAFFEYGKYAVGLNVGMTHSNYRKANGGFAGYEIFFKFTN